MTMHAATAEGHIPAASHHEGMNRGMAGMVLFIASEIMLFGGLLAAFWFLRTQHGTWPPEDTEHTVAKDLGAILTAVLLSSSVFAHIGIMGIQKNNQAMFKFGMAVAIVLGSIFIGGQIYEWFSLMDEGLNATSGVYGSTFYVITGFHGAHVIAGLLMLAYALFRATMRDFTPARHVFAEAAVLYWHFVDVIWIFVFTILYLSY
jgi:cytochrome c oxidase subunit III